ncbi:MAG: hypothetical protein AAGF73_13705 [Actinomycetota bacterium]
MTARSVQHHCPARAAIAGNPSDGYGGAVVAVPVDACRATVRIDAHARFEIDPGPTADDTFATWGDLTEHVDRFGYRGSRPLLLATLRRFAAHTEHQPRPVTIRLSTSIPRSVGLGGSSAIAIAALRCLYDINELALPSEDELASLALSVETDELDIGAGLQDRVVQAYAHPVLMEFGVGDQRIVGGLAAGSYRPVPWEHLSSLVVATRPHEAEPSHVPHNDLRSRFRSGDERVVAAMMTLADCARRAAVAIERGAHSDLADAIDDTFDTRLSITTATPGQQRSVEIVRASGGAANSTGSGGSIVALARDDRHRAALADQLSADGCVVLPVGRTA